MVQSAVLAAACFHGYRLRRRRRSLDESNRLRRSAGVDVGPDSDTPRETSGDSKSSPTPSQQPPAKIKWSKKKWEEAGGEEEGGG